ncbi:MAG: helix-turn-helix domain-containing protein [Neomegalonema sp.]|nr:helix-turn-helix domain-containing protein [Neomegalonema sp.]
MTGSTKDRADIIAIEPSVGGDPGAIHDQFLRDEPIGNLFRGARASMGGLSLEDIEAAIRIKARYLKAIEDVDPGALPGPAYLPGYVRSYAHYMAANLELTPEQVLAKFGRELSAKTGESSAPSEPKRRERAAISAARTAQARPQVSTPFGPGAGSSRAVPVVRPKPVVERNPWQGIGAAAMMLASVAVVIGLGYGAWTILHSVQQIEADPNDNITLVERRDSLGAVPSVARPAADAYDEGGALGRLDPSLQSPKDGPLRDVSIGQSAPLEDLNRVGDTGSLDRVVDVETGSDIESGNEAELPSLGEGIGEADGTVLSQPSTSHPDSASLPAQAADPEPEQRIAHAPGAANPSQSSSELADLPMATIVPMEPESPARAASGVPVRDVRFGLTATDETWVRVTSEAGVTLFERVMNGGDVVELPRDQGPLTLKTGNAGALYLLHENNAYGPIAASGTVRTLSLSPGTIPESMALDFVQTERSRASWLRQNAEDGGAE